MAVQNTYVSPNVTNDAISGIINPSMNAFRGGGGVSCQSIYETFSIAAADSSNSIYRVFKNLNANIIPIRIMVSCSAITGSTSAKLGLYLPNYGAIVGTGSQFMSAQTLAAAVTSLNPKTAIDGMANASVLTYYQRLYEYGGYTELAPTIATTRPDAFDLALTLVTAGGTLGTVQVLMDFVNA
jgi:hypothetical protein